MKYNIFYFLILIFFSSCYIPSSWVIPEDIKTMEDAQFFMETVSYYVVGDKWHSPEETYYLGGSDCVGLSGLFAHILVYKLNETDVFLILEDTGRSSMHMYVLCNGIAYEGQTGRKTISRNPDYIYLMFTYDEYMFNAHLHKQRTLRPVVF